MRRTALTAVLALAAVAVAVAALTVGGSGERDYRVAAVFDTAKGIVAGQQVKIAGAVVGSVDSVELAAGPKARIEMTIERRFAPFRADATCSILPEGLISESFVECSPGRARARLADATVPLARTTVPYALQDVLEVLSLPLGERLRVLVSQLGIATGGRGRQIDALLRRANPALQRSQRVLAIVDAQRERLARSVGDTDRVLATLAGRDGELRAFVDRAATVAETTATHRDALGSAVERLPAMLAAVRPGLRSLDRAARDATPLLGDLRTAAPGLAQLTHRMPAFARAGTPAVRALASAAERGRPAVRDAVPVVRRLGAVGGPLRPLADDLSRLLVSSRDQGALEGILKLTYVLATDTGMADETSHAFAALVDVAPHCIVGQMAKADVRGCSRKFDSPGKGIVPVNHARCGAKDPAWWNNRCSPPLPGGAILGGLPVGGKTLDRLGERYTAGRSTPPEQWRPLLDLLLK